MDHHSYKDNGLLKWEDPMNMSGASFPKGLNIPKSTRNSSKKLPPMEGKAQVDDILTMIFPPRKLNIDDKAVFQRISSEDPLKEDITILALHLQQKLKERQARMKGICDVRYEIYDEAFNELIRQVTINCPERGLLLMKVRDEMKITTASYRALYESSVVFGVRKQVQADEGVKEMEKKIKEQERHKKTLENQKIKFTNDFISLEKSYDERNSHDEAKRDEELEFLRYQNTHIEGFLRHVKTIDNPIEVKASMEKK